MKVKTMSLSAEGRNNSSVSEQRWAINKLNFIHSIQPSLTH